MFSRFIDLSISIENNEFSDPPPFLPKISYIDHQQSFADMHHFFPGLKKQDLPNEEAWAIEQVELSTHNGTHMDAPYHYASTMKDGESALTIDQIPLDWCFKPGVRLDLTHLDNGYIVQPYDIEKALDDIQYTLNPLDIVLIHTKAGNRYGNEDYIHFGCGMGRDATLYLLKRGIRVTGTDAWSWDAPFSYTAKRYAEHKNPEIIWEGHKAGRDIGYCHLEKLNFLNQLPPHGFMVSCFPIKIKNGSAGWVRAVALCL